MVILRTIIKIIVREKTKEQKKEKEMTSWDLKKNWGEKMQIITQ